MIYQKELRQEFLGGDYRDSNNSLVICVEAVTLIYGSAPQEILLTIKEELHDDSVEAVQIRDFRWNMRGKVFSYIYSGLVDAIAAHEVINVSVKRI